MTPCAATEVVGWQVGLEGWLFDGQDEASMRPMERVLFEKRRELRGELERTLMVHEQGWRGANAADKTETETVESAFAQFGALTIPQTRNAENDVVAVL